MEAGPCRPVSRCVALRYWGAGQQQFDGLAPIRAQVHFAVHPPPFLGIVLGIDVLRKLLRDATGYVPRLEDKLDSIAAGFVENSRIERQGEAEDLFWTIPDANSIRQPFIGRMLAQRIPRLPPENERFSLNGYFLSRDKVALVLLQYFINHPVRRTEGFQRGDIFDRRQLQ